MENEIDKLRILVDVVARKIEGEVKAGDTKGLKDCPKLRAIMV